MQFKFTKRQKLAFAAVLAVVALIITVAPDLAAMHYRSRVYTLLQSLQDKYSKNEEAAKNTHSMSQDQQAALLADVWQPFQDANDELPGLLPLGPIGAWNKEYTDAARMQREVTQYVSQGKEYSQAVQQLTSYYQKSQEKIKKYTGINSQTADGMRQTAAAYRGVAALRQKVVTSPFLSDVNKSYVEVLGKVASLYDQKIAAVSAGNTQLVQELDSQLQQTGYQMSALALADTPRGMDAWQAQATGKLDALIAELK